MNYTEEFRLDYYTNCLHSQNPNKEDIKITDEIKNFNWHKPYFYKGFESEPPENFPHKHGNYKQGWWWGINCGYPLKIPCITINADGYDNFDYPSLQKVRRTNLHKNVFLLPLEYHRHWIAFEKYINKNFNGIQKKMTLFIEELIQVLKKKPDLNLSKNILINIMLL